MTTERNEICYLDQPFAGRQDRKPGARFDSSEENIDNKYVNMTNILS